MSKLIVEMEMPTGCANCPIGDDDSRFCKAAKEYIPMLGRPSWCPIKGVLPEEHGNLIDRDEVKQKMIYYGFRAIDMTATEFCEDELQTVISAERKDDEVG